MERQRGCQRWPRKIWKWFSRDGGGKKIRKKKSLGERDNGARPRSLANLPSRRQEGKPGNMSRGTCAFAPGIRISATKREISERCSQTHFNGKTLFSRSHGPKGRGILIFLTEHANSYRARIVEVARNIPFAAPSFCFRF